MESNADTHLFCVCPTAVCGRTGFAKHLEAFSLSSVKMVQNVCAGCRPALDRIIPGLQIGEKFDEQPTFPRTSPLSLPNQTRH